MMLTKPGPGVFCRIILASHDLEGSYRAHGRADGTLGTPRTDILFRMRFRPSAFRTRRNLPGLHDKPLLRGRKPGGADFIRCLDEQL
jgi:hypothetical protein